VNFDYEVPYSYRGTLMHVVADDDIPEWRENKAFSATLSIDWMEPGATIKRVMVLRDKSTGTAFPMFVDDVIDLLKKSIVDHGVVSGNWRVKRTGRKNVLYTLMKVED
jgi:hypothetical protein